MVYANGLALKLSLFPVAIAALLASALATPGFAAAHNKQTRNLDPSLVLNCLSAMERDLNARVNILQNSVTTFPVSDRVDRVRGEAEVERRFLQFNCDVDLSTRRVIGLNYSQLALRDWGTGTSERFYDPRISTYGRSSWENDRITSYSGQGMWNRDPVTISGRPGMWSTDPAVAFDRPGMWSNDSFVSVNQSGMWSTDPAVAFDRPGMRSTDPAVAFEPGSTDSAVSLSNRQSMRFNENALNACRRALEGELNQVLGVNLGAVQEAFLTEDEVRLRAEARFETNLGLRYIEFECVYDRRNNQVRRTDYRSIQVEPSRRSPGVG